jgi:RNA polymerase sigma-54 factor
MRLLLNFAAMLRQNLHTIQKQQQGLHVSVQQLQLLNFIQLNTLELEQRIRDEVEENPALDADLPDGQDTLSDPEAVGSGEGPDAEERIELMDSYLPDDEFGDYLPSEDRHTPEMPDITTNLTEQEDFREWLHNQLTLLPLSPRELTIASYLVESLDDDGYLRRDIADMCDDVSFAQQIFVTEPEMEAQLETIQSLEPAGVGARDLRECLMLQLEAKPSHTSGIQTACGIVEHYLDDLGQHRKGHICTKMEITQAALEEAVALIRKLSPKPVGGSGNRLYKNQNILPEFVVEKAEDGSLTVGLLNSDRGNLRLNKELNESLEHFKQKKATDKSHTAAEQYLKSKLDSALWFIEMVRQREDSMLRTMQSMVQLQYEFFLSGDRKALKPMILKDIAEIVGLDISTISRVTSTKYALTDFGLVHLKSLFNQGMTTEDGGLVTHQELQDQIALLIQNENKAVPLSDQEIADLLSKKGYHIARRTVAKYRDLLNIPPAKLRIPSIN